MFCCHTHHLGLLSSLRLLIDSCQKAIKQQNRGNLKLGKIKERNLLEIPARMNETLKGKMPEGNVTVYFTTNSAYAVDATGCIICPPDFEGKQVLPSGFKPEVDVGDSVSISTLKECAFGHIEQVNKITVIPGPHFICIRQDLERRLDIYEQRFKPAKARRDDLVRSYED